VDGTPGNNEPIRQTGKGTLGRQHYVDPLAVKNHVRGPALTDDVIDLPGRVGRIERDDHGTESGKGQPHQRKLRDVGQHHRHMSVRLDSCPPEGRCGTIDDAVEFAVGRAGIGQIRRVDELPSERL
jgi:hypothetical protein